MLGYEDIREALAGREVIFATRVGSQVYGCAQADSDTDFIVVVRGEVQARILFGRYPPFNIAMYQEAEFQELLDNQSLYALEALQAPPEHRLVDRPWDWELDPPRFRERLLSKSENDFKKGLRIMREDPSGGRAKVWHSLRCLIFGARVLKGEPIRFEEGEETWFELMTEPDFQEEDWKALHKELQEALG